MSIIYIKFYKNSGHWLDSFFKTYKPYSERPSDKQLWAHRQYAVRNAFKHAWKGYVRDAWGFDEYHPLSQTGSNLTKQGIGYTIIDSLDTILIMGLHDEYEKSREWIATKLDFHQDSSVSLFETTIRVLGGLLSAYHLSGNDTLLLMKAKDLGDRLLGAFTTSTVIPLASVNLATRTGIAAHFGGGASTTSEATTLQLEFKYLSYLTGNEEYWRKVEDIIFHLDKLDKLDGLVPIYLSPITGRFVGQQITFGARGDSYYEYLLKQYIQTANTEPIYRRMYDEAMEGMKKRLIAKSYRSHLLYIGEITYRSSASIYPKMDHLVCFMGGNLALGATNGVKIEDYSKLTLKQKEDLWIAMKITETCVQMYFTTVTGLAPEITFFGMSAHEEDMIIKPGDSHNLLRPETVESLFLLWRITGDTRYREWGWRIFLAFEKYAKLEDGGYTSLENVKIDPPGRRDKMETFWLAETLKYLYLLFEDSSLNLLPLDKYVFNTEAHPFPIFTPSQDVRGKGWNHN